MKQISIDHIHTKAEARGTAMRWQHWQSTQVLSYAECAMWVDYFRQLANKFHLVKEFKENAIY